MKLEHNKNYMSCIEAPKGTCGALQCSTCMYRDNERYSDGFRKNEYDTGIHDWCVAHPREAVI